MKDDVLHAIQCDCQGCLDKWQEILKENMEPNTCNAPVNVEIGTPNEIVFCADPEKWIMKLTADKGILFNRDQYPDAQPDDFAKAVIEILEKHFSVTFERKEPPYDKKA